MKCLLQNKQLILETLYHKRNSLSRRWKVKQIQIKQKQFISSRSIKLMILILVQNFHERKETHFRNIAEI